MAYCGGCDRARVQRELDGSDDGCRSREQPCNQIEAQSDFEERQEKRKRSDRFLRQDAKTGNRRREIVEVPDLQRAGDEEERP